MLGILETERAKIENRLCFVGSAALDFFGSGFKRPQGGIRPTLMEGKLE